LTRQSELITTKDNKTSNKSKLETKGTKEYITRKLNERNLIYPPGIQNSKQVISIEVRLAGLEQWDHIDQPQQTVFVCQGGCGGTQQKFQGLI
jgi:hypothetical protein